jgi:hypothetical protein
MFKSFNQFDTTYAMLISKQMKEKKSNWIGVETNQSANNNNNINQRGRARAREREKEGERETPPEPATRQLNHDRRSHSLPFWPWHWK